MLQRFITDIRKYFRYSVVCAKSHLKTEVANSYLNWVWWILEPFCFMLIYAYIFGTVFNTKEQYFAAYIFIGLTMWNFFSKNLKASVQMVKHNKSVVSKVYFPKYILLLTRMWVNVFKMMISFALVVVLIIWYQIPLTWNALYAVPILIDLFLLTFGIGCFLLHYGVYVEDLSNVVNIVLQIFFYMTGIFYHLEKRIPEYGAILNQYIPTAFLLTSMRQALLYGQTPDWKMLLFWFVVGLALCVLGVRKVYKQENNYVKSI